MSHLKCVTVFVSPETLPSALLLFFINVLGTFSGTGHLAVCVQPSAYNSEGVRAGPVARL